MADPKSKAWQKFNAKLIQRKIKQAADTKNADAVIKLEKYWGSSVVDKNVSALKKKLSSESKKSKQKEKANKNLVKKKLENAIAKGNLKKVADKFKKEYGTKYVSNILSKIKVSGLKDKIVNSAKTKSIKPGSDYKAQQYHNYAGLKFAGQEGAFKIPGSSFAGFKTPEDGVRAVINQVKKDQSRNLSVRDFVTKYAPPGENDTETYIQQLSESLGVDENTNISKLNTESIATFLAKKESQTDLGFELGYGGGGGSVGTAADGSSYPVDEYGDPAYYKLAGGVPASGKETYSDVVAYKSKNQYYSVNTATGQKTKISKSDAKKLDKIDEKQYKGIKDSITNMATQSNKLSSSQIKALKKVRPDIFKDKYYGKNESRINEWWKKYGSKDYNLASQIGASALTSASYSLKNDPNYQSLPDDLKQAAAYFENAGMTSNTEQGMKLINALKLAGDQSSGYFKELYRKAEDTIIRTPDSYAKVYGTNEDRLTKRINEIQHDLAKNKEYLTLEEQSDLTRVANEYKASLESSTNLMSAKGLTDSSIRSEAETKLAQQNADIVESTKRQYGKRISDLETASQRGSTEAQRDLDELRRTYGEQITNLGRQAESQYGSAGMPSIAGYTQLGNITGSDYEARLNDTLARTRALLGESNMSSLSIL